MAKNSIEAYGALGKGNLLAFDPESLVLVTDPASPLYDERVALPLDEAMVRNIDYQGVIEPILVIKNAETGAVEVVVGRQRVKACREANRRRIERGVEPYRISGFVYRGDPRKIADVIVSENEIRQADSPLGRAEKMRRLVALGRTEEEIGVVFGCKAATVRSTLGLLDAPAAVKDAVESGAIGIAHVKELAKLPPEEQRAKVAELVEAAADAKPHERAKKQRAVLGVVAPRMRTRAQIIRELESADGERAVALRWVLGADSSAAELNLPGLAVAKAAIQSFDAEAA
ncbi:MAG: ParB/RepB/Spo0J family partition protein [Janthinobacterium lividum]